MFPSHNHDQTRFSPAEEQRLEAFGLILGAAVSTWRWKGRPKAVYSEKSDNRAVKPTYLPGTGGLRARIVAILNEHGPLRPSEIERRVERSHRPVFVALTWLSRANVVVATGKTKSRLFSTVPDWRERLSEALRADATRLSDSAKPEESPTKESQEK